MIKAMTPADWRLLARLARGERYYWNEAMRCARLYHRGYLDSDYVATPAGVAAAEGWINASN